MGLALLAGLMIAGALPPWGWWPLAVLGIGLWGWLLIDLEWRSRVLVGAVVGLSHFVVALAWVPEFTAPGYPVLVLLETTFWTVASLGVRGRWAPLGLAGALTLAEAARYNSPFEGLPLAGVDLGQAGGPLLHAARLGGGYAVTLAAGLLGAALALAVVRRWAAVGPAVVAVLLPLSGFLLPDGSQTGEPLRVAVVQGGGPVGFRGVNTDFGEVLDRHLEATATIRPESVDLVLWPENAVTVDRELLVAHPYRELLQAMNRTGAAFVVGVVEDAGPESFWNRAYLLDPAASDPEFVTKAIRVPFGEYIPSRSFVDRLVDLSAIPSEAVPGHGPGILRSHAGNFAVSISYEVLFGERSREAVNLGGQVVLVPTNAASFKRTQVPGQELAAARLRAVETGRWVLQAAPTGYSAVVDQRGVVRQRTGISEQRVLRDEVPRRSGSTPFLVTGPWPTLCGAVVLLLLSAMTVRRRRDGTSGDTPAATP
ncbi:MAG TPA: apolipoprotein N-acyltransferase [Acidimicrobiales bacterium]|nr:apolipoprotein N-acyltransferase [Acidimicrobiales bacterium]